MFSVETYASASHSLVPRFTLLPIYQVYMRIFWLSSARRRGCHRRDYCQLQTNSRYYIPATSLSPATPLRRLVIRKDRSKRCCGLNQDRVSSCQRVRLVTERCVMLSPSRNSLSHRVSFAGSFALAFNHLVWQCQTLSFDSFP